MKQKSIWLTVLITVLLSMNSIAEMSWQTKLEQQLPLLGHRNWIVIVDAAYPWQTAKGLETVSTGADQVEVKTVLKQLSKTQHIKPTIYTDAELKYVAEANAKGITAYRQELAKVLGQREVQSLPHEEIIKKLDEAGKTFHVLVLKTTMTLPYTSVFLQLECGYWNSESEKQLRDAMKSAK
jgi:D-ribose pyranose/furanose isomerase RbsD